MRAIAIALLLAPLVVKGEVPSAWPDAPEGRIVRQWNSIRFDGAFDLDGEGGALLATGDAASGEPGLRVRRFDADGADRWTADGDGVWLPSFQSHVHRPLLANDGSGGALVAWQDGTGELPIQSLVLQRVVDGAGEGEPGWAQPILIAEDLWYQEVDLRIAGVHDNTKALVADGAGGAWLVWRSIDDRLRLQHVETDGSLDADLPASGFDLEAGLSTFGLVADGAGGVWVLSNQNGPALRHMDGAGQAQPADGWLLASADAATVAGLAWSPLGTDRVALSWLERESFDSPLTLHMRSYDAALVPGQAEPLELAVLPPYSGTLQLLAEEDRLTTGWRQANDACLQVFSFDGEALWPAPVSLARGASSVELVRLSAGVDGPQALVASQEVPADSFSLRLEALDWAGSFRWAEDDALQQRASILAASALRLSANGSWLAWMADGALRACRLDSAGGDAWTESPRTLAVDRALPVQSARLLDLGPSYLVAVQQLHEVALELTVQRFDREDGLPLEEPRSIDVGVDTQVVEATADGQGGAWLVVQGGAAPGVCSAVLLRSDGGLVGPATIPGGYSNTAAASGTDGGLLIGTQQGGDCRIQRLSADGQLLWGETGAFVAPPDADSARPIALAARSDGGADVFWTEPIPEGGARGWLQSFDGEGQRLLSANGGRGYELGRFDNPWVMEGALWHEPAGTHVLAWHCWPESGWIRLDSDGATLQEERFSDLSHDAHSRVLDRAPDGSMRAAWMDDDSLRQTVWNSAGERIDEYAAPRQAYRTRLAGGWPLSLVQLEDLPDGTEATGHGIEESGGPTVALWQGQLLAHPNDQVIASSSTNVDGSLALLLQDNHLSFGGIGNRLRLQKIQAVDPAVAVDDPALAARPQALRLVGAAPNPFNPSTWITFELGAPAPVTLEVFDILGRLVRTLDAGPRAAGEHRLLFDASDSGSELASGVYVYRLRAGGESAAGRLLLLR